MTVLVVTQDGGRGRDDNGQESSGSHYFSLSIPTDASYGQFIFDLQSELHLSFLN